VGAFSIKMTTGVQYYQNLEGTLEEDDEQQQQEEEEEIELLNFGVQANEGGDQSDDDEGEEEESNARGGMWGEEEITDDGPDFETMTDEQIVEYQIAHMDATNCNADDSEMSIPHNMLLNYRPLMLPNDYRDKKIFEKDLEKEKELEETECLICLTRKTRTAQNVLDTFNSILDIYDNNYKDKEIGDILREIKRQYNDQIYEPLKKIGHKPIKMTLRLLRRHFRKNGGCGIQTNRLMRHYLYNHKKIADRMRNHIFLVNPITSKEIVDNKTAQTYIRFVESIAKIDADINKMESESGGGGVSTGQTGRGTKRRGGASSGSSSSSSSGNSAGGAGGSIGEKRYKKALTANTINQKKDLQFFGTT
jgi:hypothetical protein